jgi:hypothetical protein
LRVGQKSISVISVHDFFASSSKLYIIDFISSGVKRSTSIFSTLSVFHSILYHTFFEKYVTSRFTSFADLFNDVFKAHDPAFKSPPAKTATEIHVL